MGKYRVFEIAKEFNTTSKVVIDILSRNDVHVKNHMSSVDEGVRKIVEKTFERKADKPSVKPNTNTTIVQHASNTTSLKVNEKNINEKSTKPILTHNDRTINVKQHDSSPNVSVAGQSPQQRSNPRQSFGTNAPNNKIQGQRNNNNFQQRPTTEHKSRQTTVF